MTKSDFYKKYKLKDAKPRDPALHKIAIVDFARTLEKFTEEHFVGLAKINYDPEELDSITVSEEYSALFFKNLLANAGGRFFLNISIRREEEELLIHINPPIDLSDLEVRSEIVKSARNAGFDLFEADGGIVLTTRAHKERFIGVYARRSAKDKFKRCLSFIFYNR